MVGYTGSSSLWAVKDTLLFLYWAWNPGMLDPCHQIMLDLGRSDCVPGDFLPLNKGSFYVIIGTGNPSFLSSHNYEMINYEIFLNRVKSTYYKVKEYRVNNPSVMQLPSLLSFRTHHPRIKLHAQWEGPPVSSFLNPRRSLCILSLIGQSRAVLVNDSHNAYPSSRHLFIWQNVELI